MAYMDVYEPWDGSSLVEGDGDVATVEAWDYIEQVTDFFEEMGWDYGADEPPEPGQMVVIVGQTVPASGVPRATFPPATAPEPKANGVTPAMVAGGVLAALAASAAIGATVLGGAYIITRKR